MASPAEPNPIANISRLICAEPTCSASPAPGERQRLAALASYGILDTPREAAFDDITRIAALLCDVPIAVVNLIDRDRQWFKSEIGLGVRETPLETSICAHAILQHDMLVVPDTQVDARFEHNPLVTGEPHLRFYAGALLKTPDGQPLGTVCVLDTRPRALSDAQLDGLRALARQTMTQMELRRVLAQAQTSSRYRSRLMAIAGHDLKTPLRQAAYAIRKTQRQLTSEQAAPLTSALDALAQIDTEFTELTSLAVTDAQFSAVTTEEVALDDVLAAAVATWGKLAALKKLHLRYVPTRLRVRSHPVLLATLLGNLIGNAVKYTANGTVLVGCRRRGNHALMQIIDTGPGMDQAQLATLFQAFRQHDPASDGLGLGLWIVHSTAEALGHALDVRSVPGRGSRFSVELALS